MEYSDGENESDLEVVGNDFLGSEALFSSEAEEDGNDEQKEPKNEEPQEKQEESKDKEKKNIKPKVKKNTRAVLNYRTLSGNNGLSALKKLFKNFKFKGNGHEKEDLTKIMGILQQWMCYQLCPSYGFERCIVELEALGKKRINQVLMKKFRLGMDEWGENSAVESNITENNTEINENSNKNEFDKMLEEEMANIRSEDEELSQNENTQTRLENQQNTQMDFEVTLTAEQLERIARNRKLAEERRLKRMSERRDVNEECEKTGQEETSSEIINSEENS